MVIEQYLILAGLVVAAGVSSYYIGWKEGVGYGSVSLLELLISEGIRDEAKKCTTVVIEDTPSD
jgi:hypothetical protein